MKYIIFICISFSVMISCEEDDICLDGKTPQLFLKFQPRHSADSLRMDSIIVYRKEPNGNFDLVFAKSKNNPIDSIKVSLRIDEVNQTQLILTKRRADISLYDTLTLNYNRELAFGSKACGYKVEYIQVDYQITQQFFVEKEDLDTNITNEETPHILLYY